MYFLFALVFLALDLLCPVITNQKLKMILLIIGKKYSQKQQKEKYK